jgi:hypothetical protein
MTTMKSTRCGWLASVPGVLLLAGCGGAGLYPVEGQVVWKDGQPAKEIAGAQITFEMEGKSSSHGSLKPDGTFTLSTGERAGAPAGDYTVLIIEVGRKSIGETGIEPAKIDLRYATPSTSGLTAKVKPGKNEIRLEVDRAPKM